MVGNLVGMVTVHCCAELGDLSVATDVATVDQRPNLPSIKWRSSEHAA